MIFRLKFQDITEYAQAKDMIHLLTSYEVEFDDFNDLKEVEVVSEDEARRIMLANNEHSEDDPDSTKELSLYHAVVGDDFCIVGSSEFD